MKILIGADIGPTATNQSLFENAETERLVDHGLHGVLQHADYRIFNLEVPLADRETPVRKCGPNLIASTKSVAGLKRLGIDFLTLANNHILDQGEQGLRSTREQLDSVGIAYAGVGETLSEAAKPYIVELGGKKVGIYCCADHEFSIAGENRPGANPFDPLESLDHIAALKAQCDYAVCLYHGGKEHYRYPSPDLQKVCRKIVEKGADLVVCQHTHCIGCEEKWRNGTIVYGQGNFLFDYSNSEFWQTSILIQVNLTDFTVEYIPIQKNQNAVQLATGEEAQKIMASMQSRTGQIQQAGFVEEAYAEFAKTMIDGYMMRDNTVMKNLFIRGLNKLTRHRISQKMVRDRLDRYALLYINQYSCEAHRELILKGLESSVR